MSLRTSGDESVPRDGELDVCKEFRNRYDLEVVHERNIPNRREFTFDMYPDREELTVGVYRILGATEDSSPTH